MELNKSNFNIRDKVKVVNSGCYYPAYISMEEQLKVKNTPPLENFNDIEFTIIAKAFSPLTFLPNGFEIEETWVYGIELNSGDQFLFAEKGLKNTI